MRRNEWWDLYSCQTVFVTSCGQCSAVYIFKNTKLKRKEVYSIERSYIYTAIKLYNKGKQDYIIYSINIIVYNKSNKEILYLN